MVRARWQYLDPKDEARLKGMLEKLTGKPGETARWILEDEGRWDLLKGIAEHYLNAEPLGETWADAERQWNAVKEAAHDLSTALKSLGDMASAIRLDAAARTPGLWESVQGYLHPVPGEAFAPPVHDLEWFAKVAVEECQRMKVECNGARRWDDSGDLAFLIHQIWNLLEGRKGAQSHARRIAAVIHAWDLALARLRAGKPEEDAQALWEDPRFGERAVKRVKAHRKGARTPL